MSSYVNFTEGKVRLATQKKTEQKSRSQIDNYNIIFLPRWGTSVYECFLCNFKAFLMPEQRVKGRTMWLIIQHLYTFIWDLRNLPFCFCGCLGYLT